MRNVVLALTAELLIAAVLPLSAAINSAVSVAVFTRSSPEGLHTTGTGKGTRIQW
jgi:hypothetical protein